MPSGRGKPSSIILCMRLEEERHDEGEDDSRRNTRARRRKRPRKRLEEPLLRPLHRPAREEIAEPRDGHGGARARKLHKGLVEPERRERNAREHEHDEDLPRREIGEVDDDLRDQTDEPADRERLYEHENDFEKLHSYVPCGTDMGLPFQGDRMGDTWNALPLPRRDGGKQRPRRHEQDLFERARHKFGIEIGIEHDGRAARAAPALKFILDDVVDDLAAIHMVGGDIQPLLPCEILQYPAAEGAQIPRDDEIVLLGVLMDATKVGQNGVACGGGHGGAHIVDVGHPIVYDLAERRRRDADAVSLRRNEGSPRRRHRPLRLRRTGTAELQGIAVLPLGGCEMAARCRHGAPYKAPVDERGGDGEGLCHRRAGPVHTQEGNRKIACGEARRDDLVEEIARDDHVHLVPFEPRVFDRAVDHRGDHLAFRLFEGGFAEHVVGERALDVAADDALTLLRPRHRARCDDARLLFEVDGLVSHNNARMQFLYPGGIYARGRDLRRILYKKKRIQRFFLWRRCYGPCIV